MHFQGIIDDILGHFKAQSANLSNLTAFYTFLMVRDGTSVVINPYLEPKNVSLGRLEAKIEVFREIISRLADPAPERSTRGVVMEKTQKSF